MKLNNWSITKTAVELGLALKPLDGPADIYELCVALREGRLVVNIYIDGFDAPVCSTSVATTEAKK